MPDIEMLLNYQRLIALPNQHKEEITDLRLPRVRLFNSGCKKVQMMVTLEDKTFTIIKSNLT